MPTNSQIDHGEICRLLAIWESIIQKDNASGNFDINKWAEKLIIPVLNEVYKLQLKHLELEKKNKVAIDIGDKGKKIAYQVTVDTGVSKVKKTISKYISHNEGKKYSHLKFLYLEKKPNRNNIKDLDKLIGQNKLKFNVKQDSIDFTDIAADSKNCSPESLKRIRLYLESELLPDVTSIPQNKNGTPILEIDKSLIDEKNNNNLQVLDMYLTGEFHNEINIARDLIREYKPKSALKVLNGLVERNLLDRGDNKVKFRILANYGACYLALHKDKKAYKYFVDALQYNQDDEKALHNMALGFLLNGNYDKSIEYCEKALKKNPENEDTIALLIQAKGQNKPIGEIIKELHKDKLDIPEIISAIGFVAIGQKKYDLALQWLLKLEKKINKLPVESKLHFANNILTIILEKNNKSLIALQYKNELDQENLQKALTIYNDIADEVINSELDNFKLQLYANRSMCNYLLGNFVKALDDINHALKFDPKDVDFKLRRIHLLHETNEDYKIILDELKPLLTDPKAPTAPILAADILLQSNNEKNIKEAGSILENAIKRKPRKKNILVERESKRLLIEIYLETKRYDKALTLVDTLDLSKIVNIATKSRILRISGQMVESYDELIKAEKKITEQSQYMDFLILGHEFYSHHKYEKAAEFYEKIQNNLTDNEIYRKLIDCYWRSGNNEKVLKLFKKIRKKLGIIKDFTKYESFILEEIGDLKGAIKICLEHLKKYPDDSKILIILGWIYYRNQEINKISNLFQNIKDEDLDLTDSIRLAELFTLVGKEYEAIDLMYRTRVKFNNKQEAHQKYFSTFLRATKKTKKIDKILHPDTVTIDTVVFYKETDRQDKEYYIIEESPSEGTNSIQPETSLAKKLKGNKVNDEVILSENDFQKRKIVITEILHKFVYAFQKIGNEYNKRFPEADDLFQLKISDKQEEITKQFQKFAEGQSRQYQKAIDLYKQSEATIGMFAKYLGRNIIDTWVYMIHEPKIGIKASLGDSLERDQAYAIANKNNKLVLDFTSLLVLHGLDIKDEIVKSYELLAPQSIVDELSEVILLRKDLESEGFMTIREQEGKLYREEITKEQIKNNTHFLESLLSWVRSKCKIMPNREGIRLNHYKKQKYYHMFGRSFIDALLIAKQEKAAIYSDDMVLRSLGYQEYKVQGVWTQILLLVLTKKGILSENKYNELIVKLINSNYTYTYVNSQILFKSLEMSGYFPGTLFHNTADILFSSKSDIKSTINVIVDFITLLMSRSIFFGREEEVICQLIKRVSIQYDKDEVKKFIWEEVRRKRVFKFNELRLAEIKNILDKC